MKTTAGLWIDHRKAVIAIISEKAERLVEVRSNVEKHAGRVEGVCSTGPYESQMVQADDTREREFTSHLNQYYTEVIAAVGDVETVLIFGPGEAKGELMKRFDHAKLGGRIIAIEAVDKMSDRQIAAKVREYSHS